MPNLTPNIGLKKPLDSEDADISVIDENMDVIDEKFDPSAGHGHTGALGDGPQITTDGLADSAVTSEKLATSLQLIGAPTAPTAAAGTNSTQIANTAFVQSAVANIVNGAPGALDTLKELADALGDDANFAATVTNSLAAKASSAYVDGFVNTSPAATTINFSNGLQVVTASKYAPYNVLNIVGRTLVNLLGRDANCEDSTRWTGVSATLSNDTTNFTNGTKGLKVTLTASNGSAVCVTPNTLSTSNYYLLVGKVKNGNATNVSIYVSTQQAATQTPLITDTTAFNIVYKKFTGVSTNNNGVVVTVNGSSGQYAYADEVRLYQLSLSDYNAIDSMTAAQIDAKYPYVDDVKHVNAPYVIKYGENLLPTFNEWNLNANATVISSYSLTVNTTSTSEQPTYIDIPVLPNQTYTLTSSGGAKYRLSFLRSDATVSLRASLLTDGSKSFTAPSDAVSMRVHATNLLSFTNEQDVSTYVYGTVNYTSTNPMLNLGSTAKTFKPRNDDQIFFPNVQLASSVDGTVYDQIFKRDGKYWRENRFVRDMVLDGSLTWTMGTGFTGYKEVQISSAFPAVPNIGSEKIVKYDGKVLQSVYPSTAGDQEHFSASSLLSIAVNAADSGWGDSYTPTVQEIQAYFYGWKMYDANANPNGSGVYNRTDGLYKAWTPILSKDSSGNYHGATTTVPIAPNALGYATSYYKLTYQLATSTLEEIQVESGMTLHEGLNQIEVGQGVVVREKIVPYINTGTGFSHINGIGYAQLKNRLSKVIRVLKNGLVDSTWSSVSDGSAYGVTRFTNSNSNVDSTATYEVSYIALDQYLLSNTVQAVNGEYTNNVKTIVDTLATNQADIEARVSATENLARQLYQTLRQSVADTNLYVDATNGSDSNNGSASKPFKTITKAISMIPQVVNHTYSIYVAAGTYTEDIYLTGYSGAGQIYIYGSIGATSDNFLVYGISMLRNLCRTHVEGFKTTRNVSVNAGITFNVWVHSCTNFHVQYCKTDYVNASDNGFAAIVSTGEFLGCAVSNKNVGISSGNWSIIDVLSCTGSGNTTALTANQGGELVVIGTQPSGTTSQSVSTGGSITNSGGTINPWGDNTFNIRSLARGSNNANQSLTAGVTTKVAFQTISNDNLNEFSITNNRFTAKHSGFYDVSGFLGFLGLTTGSTTVTIATYVNGSQFHVPVYLLANSGGPNIQFADKLFLNAGDYVELYVNCSTASSIASGSVICIMQTA